MIITYHQIRSSASNRVDVSVRPPYLMPLSRQVSASVDYTLHVVVDIGLSVALDIILMNKLNQ